MKGMLAATLVVAGVLLGLWIGLWVLFIGGIVSIIEAAKATPVDAYQLAWGIVKVIVASPAGWLCVWLGLGLGTVVAGRY